MIGGVQAGYNYRLNSGLLLGVEGDFSFPNYITSNSIVSFLRHPPTTSPSSGTIPPACAAASATPAGLGSSMPPAALPGAGERFFDTPAAGDEEKILNTRLGWIAGAGIEYGFAPHWSARLEYLYSHFDNANVAFPTGAQYSSSLDFQSIRHRPQPQGRLAGHAELQPEERPDGHRIGSLGDSRPEHLSAARLSVVPRSLHRNKQPRPRPSPRRPGATACS